MSCVWCQNPEGIDPEPGISFDSEICNAPDCVYPCASVCHAEAIRHDHPLKVEHKLCDRCNSCFILCPTKALEPVGRWVTVDELLYEICVDKPFFSSTGGGVTLSGGEPTLQMDFAGRFLNALKEEKIDTAIETCGFFNYEDFCMQVLPFLDLIYFDIKLISDTESLKYTGSSNKLIIKNFSRLVRECNIPVIPRIPLIPDITNTRENLSGIAEFMKINGASNCSLMPYNPLWLDKSKRLGLMPGYKRSSFMTKEEEQTSLHYFMNSEGNTNVTNR